MLPSIATFNCEAIWPSALATSGPHRVKCPHLLGQIGAWAIVGSRRQCNHLFNPIDNGSRQLEVRYVFFFPMSPSLGLATEPQTERIGLALKKIPITEASCHIASCLPVSFSQLFLFLQDLLFLQSASHLWRRRLFSFKGMRQRPKGCLIVAFS